MPWPRLGVEFVGWFVVAMFFGYVIEGWIGIIRMAVECAGGGCPH